MNRAEGVAACGTRAERTDPVFGCREHVRVTCRQDPEGRP
jgi:hypothetical protein